MSTHTTPVASVMAVAVTALALAACGGGEGSGGGGKSEQEKFQEYALKDARCMRRHGIDVPDPKPGHGMILNGDVANPEAFDRARRACEREVGKPPVPQLSEKEQREFREAALGHARCMRAQGIDFPDPTFGANGEVRIDLGDSGLRPDDPAFRAADAKCRKYLGKAGVTQTKGPGG